MSGKAAKVTVTETHHAILGQLAQSRTVPQRLIQRAQVILLAFAGVLNTMIAEEVGLDRRQVGAKSRILRDGERVRGLK